jgi:hypothetical protein
MKGTGRASWALVRFGQKLLAKHVAGQGKGQAQAHKKHSFTGHRQDCCLGAAGFRLGGARVFSTGRQCPESEDKPDQRHQALIAMSHSTFLIEGVGSACNPFSLFKSGFMQIARIWFTLH